MVVVEVVVGEAGVVVVAELAADVEAEAGAAVVGGEERFEQVFLGFWFKGFARVFEVDAVVMDADGEGFLLAVFERVVAQIPEDLVQVFRIKMNDFVMRTNDMYFLGFAEALSNQFIFQVF